MSTLPGRSSEPHYEPTRNAVLGKSVIVKGQIFSREDLTIDGEVEGTVELQEHRLTIGPNGKVRASVKARELVVLGTIHGDVETSDKIDIRKEARLVGDIKTARIVIASPYMKGGQALGIPWRRLFLSRSANRFLTWFTNRVFEEDRIIVEMEQAAYDAQGSDWNQEVFPPIRELRELLARNGRVMGAR